MMKQNNTTTKVNLNKFVKNDEMGERTLPFFYKDKMALQEELYFIQFTKQLKKIK
jgi:hypothetical protein